MVSVDETIRFEEALRESPKASAFNSYLQGREVDIHSTTLTEADKIYYSMLTDLSRGKKDSFKVIYEDLAQRKLLKEQPLIYDNFFLFILITGVLKFNLSKDWVKNVLALRETSNEPEKSITISFVNLVNENFLSTEGITPIVLCSLVKQNSRTIDAAILRNAYEGIKQLRLYAGRDLFLASIHQCSYEYIIAVAITDEAINLKNFEITFLKRIRLLQNVFYIVAFLVLLSIWLYLTQRYPKLKDYTNTLNLFLTLFGTGLLALGLNKLKFYFGKSAKHFFGYKKSL